MPRTNAQRAHDRLANLDPLTRQTLQQVSLNFSRAFGVPDDLSDSDSDDFLGSESEWESEEEEEWRSKPKAKATPQAAQADKEPAQGKPTQGLIPEVWVVILGHLKQPLPRSNGKATRESIRQKDLATMMRVNKFFHNICGPILYKHVICDRLTDLVVNLGSGPRIRGVRTKRELLGLTQRLSAEYCSKGEPSYVKLIRERGLYAMYSPSDAEMEAFCRTETLAVQAAATKLYGEFTSLLYLTAGVYLGGQREIWEPIWTKSARTPGSEMYARLNDAIGAFSFLYRYPHITYYCSRSEYGPLTFGSTQWSDPIRSNLGTSPNGPKSYINWTHMDGPYEAGCCPLVANGQGVWLFTFDKDPNDPRGRRAIENLTDLAERMLWLRETSWKRELPENRARILASSAITVDIYLPSHMTSGTGAIQRVEEALKTALKKYCKQEKIPDERVAKDVWRIKRIDEASPCTACGWCPDDL